MFQEHEAREGYIIRLVEGEKILSRRQNSVCSSKVRKLKLLFDQVGFLFFQTTTSLSHAVQILESDFFG